MSGVDRSTKRMKGDAPMGGGPPPEGYYGQPPPGGRYAPYGGPGGPPMGPQSGYMWQQGHAPPPHSWGHASPPPPGSMYGQRGGPSMTPDRSGYGGAYPRGPPPPMQGPGGVHRGAKPPGPVSRQTGKPLDGPPNAPPGPPDVPGHQQGYQGGYYPPPQGPYGSSPYPPSGPPPMHHPSSYGSPPPPPTSLYGTSPPRSRPRASPELMGAYSPGTIVCQTTHTDNPDLDGMYSRGVGPHDDDGNGSIGGGGNSKDKGRGSYKCGRCGVPKKGHVCPYQPKLTRRPGEPLPEMRSAAIQVEMDEFMTLRRLNLRIQGFPESYASEAYGEDMVIGEPHPHPHPPMTVNSPPISHSDMMVDGPPLLTSHDPVLGSPIRSSPLSNDPISAA